MIVTVLWWVLVGSSGAIEIVARVRPDLIAPLSRLGARLATLVPLRAILWLGWIFVGVHVFARYTMARH